MITTGGSTFYSILEPLQMKWEPKEDISTYELALCLPFLLKLGTGQSIMPQDINQEDAHMRHFKIYDPNSFSVSNMPTATSNLVHFCPEQDNYCSQVSEKCSKCALN